MGSRISTNNENDCIIQINNINENDLDLSNIDKLQIERNDKGNERSKGKEER